MSVATALARGRAAHARLMLDTVTIARKTPGAFSQATGEYSDTWTTIYTGPADVKPADQRARSQDAAETATVVGRFDVKVPFGSPLVKVEDRITPTASPDTHLVGRVLYVLAVGLGARRTAWHITAVDQEQP